MSEEVNNDFEEMIGSVMDGASHSQDDDIDSDSEKALEESKEPAPEADAADSVTMSEGEEAPVKTDSAAESQEDTPEEDYASLQRKVANYEKRLHDTQRAMHQATAEKAELQKQLEALKKGDSSEDDNWFSDSDDKGAELETKVKELSSRQEEIQRDLVKNQWMNEAQKLATQHEDFNSLVFEKLEPLLDEENGDPRILALYKAQSDHSPAGAYAFARKLSAVLDALNGTGSASEKTKRVETAPDPTKGKAGLDRINSAEFSEKKQMPKNMIDEVFG